MSLERNIANYIKSMGINLTVVARQTGISYMVLYDSLFNENKKRQLRGKELISVCQFLDKDPMDFVDEKVS